MVEKLIPPTVSHGNRSQEFKFWAFYFPFVSVVSIKMKKKKWGGIRMWYVFRSYGTIGLIHEYIISRFETAAIDFFPYFFAARGCIGCGEMTLGAHQSLACCYSSEPRNGGLYLLLWVLGVPICRSKLSNLLKPTINLHRKFARWKKKMIKVETNTREKIKTLHWKLVNTIWWNEEKTLGVSISDIASSISSPYWYCLLTSFSQFQTRLKSFRGGTTKRLVCTSTMFTMKGSTEDLMNGYLKKSESATLPFSADRKIIIISLLLIFKDSQHSSQHQWNSL